MKFTKAHIKQIEDKGLTVEKINKQIELFKTGLPYVTLKSAAVINHGILSFTEEENTYFSNYYQSKKEDLNILKFVPASGAATRMFKFLFAFLENYSPKKESINSYINKQKASDLSIFLVGLEKLPFYNILIEATRTYYTNFDTFSIDEQALSLIKTVLNKNQLNYGFYPKGLLPFHKYKDHIATAFEEHLFEASLYASSKNVAKLHFTISENHKHIFDEEFKRIETIVKRKTNTEFDISFSYQKEATDTIAVTTDNKPVLNLDGSLHFRPSGHGALLQNLSEFDADVIFIKNIDNVVVYRYEETVAKHKKILAGLLLELQNKTFNYLKAIEEKELLENDLIEITNFVSSKLNVMISTEFEKYSKKNQINYLKGKLNRPIRVCGMVKNEGEPGGGPFWVKDENGNVSLQIVESAQINKKDKKQKNILKKATYFNPVDLVCGIKDYDGNVFDLSKFIDPKTAFITMKTKTGKDIKALELPGLWNGSMASWNTIFVEVPIITFNPVKTVTDLLKATHQV